MASLGLDWSLQTCIEGAALLLQGSIKTNNKCGVQVLILLSYYPFSFPWKSIWSLLHWISSFLGVGLLFYPVPPAGILLIPSWSWWLVPRDYMTQLEPMRSTPELEWLFWGCLVVRETLEAIFVTWEWNQYRENKSDKWRRKNSLLTWHQFCCLILWAGNQSILISEPIKFCFKFMPFLLKFLSWLLQQGKIFFLLKGLHLNDRHVSQPECRRISMIIVKLRWDGGYFEVKFGPRNT